MRPLSELSYGGPGSGKTVFGLSSFWDLQEEKLVPGQTGRWLLVGRESNDALGVPEEYIKRFPLPSRDPIKFIEAFQKYLRALVARAMKGGEDHIQNVLLDGWSELCAAYTWAFEERVDYDPKDKWATWREWKREFVGTIQMLNPDVLNANVFGTARIAELRKGTRLKSGEVTGKDPEWMEDFKYHPAIDGWAKYNLGHYFNFVVYHEQDFETKVVGGKKVKVPQFKSHWQASGEYVVKNIFGHKWGRLGLDPTLVNGTWRQVKEVLGGGDK